MKKIKSFKNFFARHYFNLRHLRDLEKYGAKDSDGSLGLHSRYGKVFK